MRIGIPIWNGRVSPVLDAAERMLVVETREQGAADRREVLLNPDSLSLQAARISQVGLDLLVCGAVSRMLADMLASTGLTVIPWIAGEVNEVLRALESQQLQANRFSMPGCCRRRGREGRHGRMQAGGRHRPRRLE